MKIKAGHYVFRNSIPHSCDARIKIICFLLIAVATFFVSTYVSLACVLLTVLALCLFSHINVFSLLRSVWGFLLGLLFLALLNMFFVQSGDVVFNFGVIRITNEGFFRAILYSGRLTCLLLAGALLLATTSPFALTEGLASLFRPLQVVKIPVSQATFVLSLALRFVPIIVDETYKIAIAQMCRGASFNEGSIIKRLKAVVSLIIPVFISAFNYSQNLSDALLSKNYVPGKPRTRWSFDGYLKRMSGDFKKRALK